MATIKRLVLDVLKAHEPGVVEFAKALSGRASGYTVHIRVIEMDEKTETLEVSIEASNIDHEALLEKIVALGASVHSIDQVTVAAASPKK